MEDRRRTTQRKAGHACGRILRRGLVALAAIGVVAGRVAAQDETVKTVTRSEQGYSVDANGTNVVQVLTEVGQQAGFTVEAPEDFHSPLTVSLQDAPLDDVLRRVLRNENYIIVYRGGEQRTSISGDKIDKIFLLSQAAEGAGPPPGGVSPLAGPGGGAKPAGRGALAPPPPQPGVDPNADDPNADIATRSAQARARAEARRAALGQAPAPGAIVPPVPPGTVVDPARMVQAPDDFTPPPIDEPEPPPHADVPPHDVPPDDGGDEEY